MNGDSCIPALKALSDETRLRIVRLLSESPRNVTEIAEKLNLTHYNTSKHLKILRAAGLLECEKQGQQRRYGIPESLQTHLKAEGDCLDLGCCSFRFDSLPG